MATTRTGSILKDGTRTALSTNILIQVNAQTVGAIQTFNINETRNIKMISEIGTDGHIDSCPQSSTDISGSCNRIRFDGMRIAQAMGRGYIHIHSQRYPFDVVIIDTWKGGDNATQLITTIKSVWFSSIKYAYKSDDFLIVEDSDWKAEAIYSTLNNGNAAINGGERNIPLQLDPIEQAADRGDYRGSLDAPGLFNAFYSK